MEIDWSPGSDFRTMLALFVWVAIVAIVIWRQSP